MTLSNRRYDHLDHEFLFYDEHDADTIPVCMVATETPALRAVILENLATGADWSVTSKKLATGRKLGG